VRSVRFGACSPAPKTRVDWYEVKNLGVPMNRFAILALILSAAMPFSSAAHAAMPIQVYERLSNKDQGDYEVQVLLVGAKQVLKDAGRPDQVAQIEKLFTTRQPGDQITLGMGELELNIAAVDKADADNLVRDPNAKPLSVELAMIATLKANGIILPKSFMHVGDTFDAKEPLSPPPKFGPFAQCFAYRNGACASH